MIYQQTQLIIHAVKKLTMPFIKKVWKFVKPVVLNKYLITLIIFGVLITFFDNHNLINRWETQRKIRELQKEYNYYQTLIEHNKEQIYKLKNDKEYLEKFAREKYQMKRKDEDVFIIKE